MLPTFNSCFYTPFVGVKFGKSILGKKVLAVGASHYCDKLSPDLSLADGCGLGCKCLNFQGECHSFTCNVIGEYMRHSVDEPWMHTYTKFFNSFFATKPSNDKRNELIQTTAFMNFLQRAEGKNAREKHIELFYDKQNFEAMSGVIDGLGIEVVIIWGRRVWNAIHNNLATCQVEGDILRTTIKGREVLIVGLYHPSYFGFYRKDPQRLYRIAGLQIVK